MRVTAAIIKKWIPAFAGMTMRRTQYTRRITQYARRDTKDANEGSYSKIFRMDLIFV
jgi:hypothetical protein